MPNTLTETPFTPPTALPATASELLQALDALVGVVARLRDPETGCPWDLKQTHASLRPHMLEEAYEATEAMLPPEGQAFSPTALCEELGDVLLQVLLHAQIASDAGLFTLKDVAEGLASKLVRRHPHVFKPESAVVDTPEAVTLQWEALKREEKNAGATAQGETGNHSGLLLTESVLQKEAKPNVPALVRAQRVSEKAVKVGFAWPTLQALWACVYSEFKELEEALEQGATPSMLEEELGDCLFATVSLAHHLNLNGEVALTRATDKFLKRFYHMEAHTELSLEDLSFEQWDTLWKAAKQA